MARDDFSTVTANNLAKRVGNTCSNPACRAITSGPHSDAKKALNLGVAAHITAASPGGARYDEALTSEQRKSPANGIWLCQTCAKLVDNDAVRFPVELLHDWKRRTEDSVLAAIEHREVEPQASSFRVAIDGLQLWRNRGNLPGDTVYFIDGWGTNDFRYSFKLRLRSSLPYDEVLHRLRIQYRSGSRIVHEDWYTLPDEVTLKPNSWHTIEVNAGLHSSKEALLSESDSVWFAAEIVGATDQIESRIAKLDHATPLPVQ